MIADGNMDLQLKTLDTEAQVQFLVDDTSMCWKDGTSLRTWTLHIWEPARPHPVPLHLAGPGLYPL